MSPNEEICGCDNRRLNLNCKKQGLCFTLKWFPICFPFLFFVLLAREKEKKKKRKERKLDAEGRIIKRGPHCIFHDMFLPFYLRYEKMLNKIHEPIRTATMLPMLHNFARTGLDIIKRYLTVIKYLAA